MLNEGNQIHNFISCYGSGNVINYGSGSDFFNELRFRFHKTKSSGSYGSGSGSCSTTLPNIFKDTKPLLFLKIDQYRYLATGVYLSEAPRSPPPLLHTV